MIVEIQIIRDTVAVISNEQVAAFYADMIDKQQDQFNILLVAIGLIVAAVIGSTWWWNYKGSKAQITKEIQDGITKYQRLFTAHKSSTEKMINEEVDKRVKAQMDALSTKMKDELESYKETITLSSKRMNANLCRVFALHCSTDKDYFYSATWWLSAFEDYVEVKDGEFEQISIDAYVNALDSCFKEETLSDDQKESLDDLKERTSKIPDVFTDQRNKAKRLLKKIEDKSKKEGE